MIDRECGIEDLRRHIVNGGPYEGTTHDVARQIIKSMGDEMSTYVVTDTPEENACVPQIAAYTVHYRTMLEVLDELANMGGEEVAIYGTKIIFYNSPALAQQVLWQLKRNPSLARDLATILAQQLPQVIRNATGQRAI